jgi:hypothetical protein
MPDLLPSGAITHTSSLNRKAMSRRILMPMASIPSSLLIRIRAGEIGEKGDMGNLGKTEPEKTNKRLQGFGANRTATAA